MGDRWSVAWRVLDAQFWGVPQRRRRIALVADFGGKTAPEILFVREGLSGNSEQSKPKRKETSGNYGERPAESGLFQPKSVMDENWQQSDKKNAIRAGESKSSHAIVCSVENHPADSRVDIDESGNVPMVMEPKVYESHPMDGRIKELDEVSPTVTTKWHKGAADTPLVCERTAQLASGGAVTGCLMASGYEKLGAQEMFSGDYTVDRPAVPCVDVGFFNSYEEKATTLLARMYKDPPIIKKHIVRRLTPLECERLQGFPDGWTDIGEWVDSKGKKHKEADSPRYKALGNSVAIPPWKWVLKRLCACYERDATMASLFDGIGGFPYIWEQINGKGSCLWASEIEEFPMAVTKVRFWE